MTDDTPSREAQCVLAARLLAERLDGLVGGWSAVGANVTGPGTTGLGIVEHLGTPDGHVDIGFLLNRHRSDAPVLWDCAAGAGESIAGRVGMAVETWMAGTWPVLRELLSGRGEHAAHCGTGHPLGLPGWHVLRGPLMAFGDTKAAEALQAWAVQAPLLRTIAAPLVDAFDRPALNGIKLVLGPEVAEVRINGRVDPEASKALGAVPLPDLPAFAFLRCFSLAVSPDRAPGAA